MGFVLLAMNFEDEVWIHSLQVSADSVASFAGCLPPSSIWLVVQRPPPFPPSTIWLVVQRPSPFPVSFLLPVFEFYSKLEIRVSVQHTLYQNCLLPPLQLETMLYFCEESGVCHMQGAVLNVPLVCSDVSRTSVTARVSYAPQLPKPVSWNCITVPIICRD